MAARPLLVQIGDLAGRGHLALANLGRACASCGHPNCCAIEPPFLTNFDINRISEQTGATLPDFVDTNEIEPDVYVNSVRKSPDGTCIFYDSANGCGIYKSRPIDCRLFPLDIKLIDGRLTWIVYTTCPDGIFDAGPDWMDLARIAEIELLAPLQLQISAFIRIPTKAFEDGSWRALREVRFQD
jgi:putative zinc- or iron-chelating protein